MGGCECVCGARACLQGASLLGSCAGCSAERASVTGRPELRAPSTQRAPRILRRNQGMPTLQDYQLRGVETRGQGGTHWHQGQCATHKCRDPPTVQTKVYAITRPLARMKDRACSMSSKQLPLARCPLTSVIAQTNGTGREPVIVSEALQRGGSRASLFRRHHRASWRPFCLLAVLHNLARMAAKRRRRLT